MRLVTVSNEHLVDRSASAVGCADDRCAHVDGIEAAFRELRALEVEAVIVPGNLPVALSQVADFALRSKLPSISLFRQYAQAGGLMSYGASAADLQRRAAGHVDKILRGARPEDLPVERPTKLALILNQKVASVLGLRVPASVMLQAG
jgi:putative ABC transport system substrate-binding protein